VAFLTIGGSHFPGSCGSPCLFVPQRLHRIQLRGLIRRPNPKEQPRAHRNRDPQHCRPQNATICAARDTSWPSRTRNSARGSAVRITLRSRSYARRFAAIAAGIALQAGAYYHTLMRTISLKLPEALLAQLDQEARARRTTKSSLVRESLTKTLSQEKPGGALSCFDAARDLAGSVRGLPEDIVVNPDYMAGFGR
jgi:hypothetical protein